MMAVQTKICLALVATLMLTAIVGSSFAGSVKASISAVATVNLGGAEGFTVSAGAEFTEGTGNVISGNTIFGVAGASSGPGLAASTAFADAEDRTANFTSGALDFGVNRTITSGVYRITSDVSATGTLTLDFQNDPNSVFIFQVSGYLITAAGFDVVLTNGANAANIFWQIDTYFSPGASTNFKGTVLAGTYITTGADLNLDGRLFAISGAVTTGANNILNVPSSPTTTTTTTTVPSTTTTTAPTTTTTTTVPSTTTTTAPTTTTVPSTTTTTAPTTTTVPSITARIFSVSLAPIVAVKRSDGLVRKMRIPWTSVLEETHGTLVPQFATVVIRPSNNYKNLTWHLSLSIHPGQSTETTKSIIPNNYLTICATATARTSKLVTSLHSPFHILIPKIFSKGGTPTYSRNEDTPSVISKLRLQRLPVRVSKGYFIKASGEVKLYSRDPGCFTLQTPLK
jgi:cell division septation protein DedD